MGRFKHSTNVGFTLAAAGAIILSLEVIFLRSLSDINGFQIMLYRSVSVSFVFLSFILLFTNQKTNVNSIKFNFKEILSGFFIYVFFCLCIFYFKFKCGIQPIDFIHISGCLSYIK